MRRDIPENKSLKLRSRQKSSRFSNLSQGTSLQSPSLSFPPPPNPLPGHFQLERQVHEQLRTSHQKHMTPWEKHITRTFEMGDRSSCLLMLLPPPVTFTAQSTEHWLFNLYFTDIYMCDLTLSVVSKCIWPKKEKKERKDHIKVEQYIVISLWPSDSFSMVAFDVWWISYF